MRKLCSSCRLLAVAGTLLLFWVGGAGPAEAATINLGDVTLGQSFTSGNGKLEFSNFSFDSPDCIDPSDITLEILEDGVMLSGPVGAWGTETRTFSVDYRVTALDPSMPIVGSSLELDSNAFGSPKAGVFATKQITAQREHEHGFWLPMLFFDKHGKGFGKHDRDFGEHDEHGWWRHGKWSRPRDQLLTRLETFDIDKNMVCDPAWSPDMCSKEWVKLFDSDEFHPRDKLGVTDTVKIFSKGEGDAEWFSSINRFSVVPEPGTASLLGAGLVGLFLAGKRRR